MTINFTLTRDDREIDVVVKLTYFPASRGYRDRYGCPEEPDEPATFEVNEVSDKDGNDYDLTDSEYDEVMEKAFAEVQDDREDY